LAEQKVDKLVALLAEPLAVEMVGLTAEWLVGQLDESSVETLAVHLEDR
jgi:hypothetical protein